jgi:hypothetical protein
VDSLAIKIADNPVTARNAYIVKPIPCPIPVKTPCVRPPDIVFLITTAKLGPGDIAPSAQTTDIPNNAVKSIITQ